MISYIYIYIYTHTAGRLEATVAHTLQTGTVGVGVDTLCAEVKDRTRVTVGKQEMFNFLFIKKKNPKLPHNRKKRKRKKIH